MISLKDFKEYLIRKPFKEIGLYSHEAEKLCLGTAATESHLGKYLSQLGGGPARGPFQCEYQSYLDLFQHALQKDKFPHLNMYMNRALKACNYHENKMPPFDELATNLKFAALICRLDYYREPEPLPKLNDLEGMASYWKRYYNSRKGKGTIDQFMHDYKYYVENG